MRDDGQGRGVHDLGTVTLEGGGELFRAPLSCEHDATSDQLVADVSLGLVHAHILVAQSHRDNFRPSRASWWASISSLSPWTTAAIAGRRIESGLSTIQ